MWPPHFLSLCVLKQKDPALELTLSFTEPSDLTAQEVRYGI